jgi:serine/threonine protein kinase
MPDPAATPASDALPRLTRFEVLREIGRGGAGIVYAAVERESGRRVALKTLRAMDAPLLLQLKSEFRALQDLEHPNLIRLEHLMREGDTWFFTMELVNGVPITTYVTGGAASSSSSSDRSDDTRAERAGGIAREPARFDEGRLRDALAQLARGLAALHAAGRVHRDI